MSFMKIPTALKSPQMPVQPREEWQGAGADAGLVAFHSGNARSRPVCHYGKPVVLLVLCGHSPSESGLSGCQRLHLLDEAQ